MYGYILVSTGVGVEGSAFKNTSAWDSLGLVKSEFLWKGKDIPRWIQDIHKELRQFQGIFIKKHRVMEAKKKPWWVFCR